MIKWVLRDGWGVETDFEVRVRFPSVVMEVVELWGHNLAGGRLEREARRDECGPMVQYCRLLVGFISFVMVVVPLKGAGGAL